MKKLTTALLACSALFTAASNAAIVTINGADVSFTYDDSTVFGSANVVGNSIFFQPTNFIAESLNDAGAVSLRETLTIDVQATTTGYDMSSFLLAEQGDYQLKGSSSSVSASGRLGVASMTTATCGTFGIMVCNDFNIFNVANSDLNTVGALTAWNGSTSVDLADTIGWGSDSFVQLSLQNNLSATSTVIGDEAMIQKKFGAIGITVNPVPVPAALWLFGSGLIGLAAFVKRKKT